MKKTLIIYGSTTGNTEYTAETIFRILQSGQVETTLKNVREASGDDLAPDFDAILLGCSTWGDEDIELQEDFIPFFESMEDRSLDKLRFGVFGCGDSSYTHFCGAVDEIEELIGRRGGEVLIQSLKIDGDPDDVKIEIQDWAESIRAAMVL